MAYTSAITDDQKYKIFAPFFESIRAKTASKYVDYDCLFCSKPVLAETSAARSFTGTAIVWAHPECLRTVPGAALSTDKKAKHKAHEAFKERQAVARKAARDEKQTSAPAPDIAAITAEITTTIEAKYKDAMQTAIDYIASQRLRIDTLEALLERYQATGVWLQAPAPRDEAPVLDQQTVNARQNDSALTPAEKAQDKPGVIRCGSPKKDGAPCQWNTAKSPCRHHGVPAVVKAMSDPKNETTVDVVKTESSATLNTVKPTSGEFDVTFVELSPGQSVIRLYQAGVMQADTDRFAGYLPDDASIITAFKTIPNGSRVRVHIKNSKVISVKLLVPTESAKKAKKNAGK